MNIKRVLVFVLTTIIFAQTAYSPHFTIEASASTYEKIPTKKVMILIHASTIPANRSPMQKLRCSVSSSLAV